MPLPACCAMMSDTDIVYGAICLPVLYAISGTDIANTASGLRARYAMSSTDVVYGGIRHRAVMRARVTGARAGGG
eukprot:3936491-Rhodomonas_salina.6